MRTISRRSKLTRPPNGASRFSSSRILWPCLASTAWTCALSPERSATSLHRCRTASRSPHLWWRDPCLRQPAHPQQIRQIGRVAFVVLHPPVGEALESQRMRQVHDRAGVGQHVRRPVPAVSRLQDDFGILTPRGDLRRQLERVVVDAHRATQPLTVRRHPNDHAAPPVQIYPDKLPAPYSSTGPPSSWWSEQPKRYAGVNCHKEWRPRSFIASENEGSQSANDDRVLHPPMRIPLLNVSL